MARIVDGTVDFVLPRRTPRICSSSPEIAKFLGKGVLRHGYASKPAAPNVTAAFLKNPLSPINDCAQNVREAVVAETRPTPWSVFAQVCHGQQHQTRYPRTTTLPALQAVFLCVSICDWRIMFDGSAAPLCCGFSNHMAAPCSCFRPVALTLVEG